MKIKNKNIVLIGFMGCGKTSVGRRLAGRTGRGFIETDAEIEKRLGKRVAEIFEEHGEGYFREIESEICRVVSGNEGHVISTGGGVVKTAGNIEFLRDNGFIVYLKASPRHLHNNLKNDTERPLLAGIAGNDRYTLIERMLRERNGSYEECSDLIVDVTDRGLEDIVAQLEKRIDVLINQ